MGLIGNIGDATFTDPSGPASTSTARVQPVSAAQDQVHLATIPLTSQAEQQLLAKVPPNLPAVLGEAIRNLRAAAVESSNPIDAAYLSGLADRFERLQATGGTPFARATSA
jgi:hypothetical protein